MFVKLLVEFGHAIRIRGVALVNEATKRETGGRRGLGEEIFVLKKWSGPVDDFVATALEIAAPIEGAFVEFCATRDDEFLHG